MTNSSPSYFLGGNATAENADIDLDELGFFGTTLDSTDINDIFDNGLVQAPAARRVIMVH